ncbi:uncharacterized protein [Onthophagus taurus]|uniref:uncharacterized protein isoform X4 n=1 Tax=Onthophagus taurus TaxID=166361 RepID=UPI0039BDA81E
MAVWRTRSCRGRIVYSYVTPTDFLIISESEVVPSHFFILFGGVILPPPPLIPLDMVDLTGEEEVINLTAGDVNAVNSAVQYRYGRSGPKSHKI